MEELVRKILSNYLSYVSEKEMYERWLQMRENKEAREALVMVEMKVTMIQSWFNLLNTDERFVIEKHLLEELEWPRVAFTFTEKWKGEFSRTERTLIGYQASGLAKMWLLPSVIIKWCYPSFPRRMLKGCRTDYLSRPNGRLL